MKILSQNSKLTLLVHKLHISFISKLIMTLIFHQSKFTVTHLNKLKFLVYTHLTVRHEFKLVDGILKLIYIFR